MRSIISILALALVTMTSQSQERPMLTVYTYDSFSSDWGPGPAVKEAFEARCEEGAAAHCGWRCVAAGRPELDGRERGSRVLC